MCIGDITSLSLTGPARGRLEAAAAPERGGDQHLLGLVAAERRPLAEGSRAGRQDRPSAVGSLPGNRQASGAGAKC